jgi:hypothetical protein
MQSFEAQHGDQFFISYKGCRLSIDKRNPITGSNNVIDEFVYL